MDGKERGTISFAAHPRPPNKARSRSPSATENNQGRKRKGRPRIRPEQEAFSDKRRTQVRLAQRAYRSRKEAMVSTLKGRIEQLEMLVEEINKTFLGFTDDMMKRGILEKYPDLARNLYHTIQESLALTNRAISVANDEVIGVATAGADAYVSETGANTETPRNGAGKSAGSASTTPDAADSQFPDTVRFSQPIVQNMNSRASKEQISLRMSEIPTHAVQIPTTTLLLDTLSFNAYNSGPASFAQRLYHACVEQGYQCLRDPWSKPGELSYVFRLPLKVLPPHDLVAYFEDILKHGHYPTVMEWDIPFISIGGAGTHFRHDQRGYVLGETSSIIRVETEQVDPDMRGDWFDCYDVEGYLRENMVKPIRGLITNSRASLPPPLPALDDELQNQCLSGQGLFEEHRRPIFVDESMLIERLRRSCVCLGRAPGFPRATVEYFVMEYGKYDFDRL